jgi:hypothetical protein
MQDNSTDNPIVKLQSALPTPTPSTMAMFHIVEEEGSYTVADGSTQQGVVVKVYSTDDNTAPEHRVGTGSEFEMMGQRYRVQKIVRSTNYKKSGDEVWLEVLKDSSDEEE